MKHRMEVDETNLRGHIRDHFVPLPVSSAANRPIHHFIHGNDFPVGIVDHQSEAGPVIDILGLEPARESNALPEERRMLCHIKANEAGRTHAKVIWRIGSGWVYD